MRNTLMLLLILAATFLAAQPGELFFQDPCPTMDRELHPLDIVRPDLRLYGISEGTDDVPSSSGQCIQAVATLPHVRMLYRQDVQGNWDLWYGDEHGTLDPSALSDGLAKGTYRWDQGDLRVAWMGYGSAYDGNGWKGPDTGHIRLLIRANTSADVMLAVVRLSTTKEVGFAGVITLGAAPEGTPLNWRTDTR